MSAAGLRANRTRNPEARRKASERPGRKGSLVATRSVPFSTPTGITLYWKTALVGTFSRISPAMGLSPTRT